MVSGTGMDYCLTLWCRHPDKHATSAHEKQKAAELEFKKIAWAYEVLSSNTKRQTFMPGTTTSTPFNFASYWEEWGSTSWANFWDPEEGTAVANFYYSLFSYRN